MKKILFLTYYYAPYNITGSFRITRFIKYLSRKGIKPYIITAKHNNTIINYELNNDIPSSAIVIRKPAIFDKYQSFGAQLIQNPSKRSLIHKIRLLIKDLIFSPDIQIVWSFSIIRKACKLIKQEKIKYLFVNGGPFSLFIAGIMIKKITGVKLILDFRDPWSKNPNQLNQSSVRKIYNNIWEKKCLKHSYTTISVNDLIINELRNRHPQGRFIIIPNSIDYEEYSDLLTEKGNQNNFLFGYAGKFDINNESYNPANLLAGFRNFILDNKQEKKIVLRVYSEINLTTKEYVSNLGISDNIELMGYCSKRDVIEGLSKCDAFIQFYYPKKLYNALSIKVFDYTYFKKPILSINTKSGILADYINKSRIGFVSENDSIDEITRNFQKIFTINLEKFKQNINAEYLARYSISKQISNLLEIFK